MSETFPCLARTLAMYYDLILLRFGSTKYEIM